jgi:cell division protein FtsL
MNPSLPIRTQRVTRLVQAYRQAPWRTQRQWIVLFLLAMVSLGMVAGLYLNVTARAALAGREVQGLEASITANERINDDLETQIASALSTDTMSRRAAAMGFVPVTTEELEFLPVSGYLPPAPASLVAPSDQAPSQAGTNSQYTQSLLDWLNQKISAASLR